MIKITCDCGHTAEYDESEIHSHRLMCGDSTSIDDVEKLMDGRKADLVLTDPPYGMKKENDGLEMMKEIYAWLTEHRENSYIASFLDNTVSILKKENLI